MPSEVVIFALVGVVAAVASAKVLPEQTQRVAMWLFRIRKFIGALVGLSLIIFFLSSGVTVLVVLGLVGVVMGTWWLLFSDLPDPRRWL